MDIFNFNYKFYIDFYNLNENLNNEEAFEHFLKLKNKNNIYFNYTHSYYYYNHDWEYYIFIYNDLNKTLKTKQQGFEHYMTNGKKENRIMTFNKFFIFIRCITHCSLPYYLITKRIFSKYFIKYKSHFS